MKRLTISGDACTETLALLIAVAWADGRLDDQEKAGVRGALPVLNLTKVLRDRIDHLLEHPAKVSELYLSNLNPRERTFAFVAAAWMARVDGVVDPAERAMLDEIAAALAIPPSETAGLETLAASLDAETGTSRHWSEEITKLFEAIQAKLQPSS